MKIKKPKQPFIDAQEMAERHPSTFEIPSKKQISKLKIGDTVKVCVGKERFWNIIKEIKGGKIIAEVDNELVYTNEHGLDLGDIISFKTENIYQIYEP